MMGRVRGSGFRVQSSRCRVQGSGFRVQSFVPASFPSSGLGTQPSTSFPSSGLGTQSEVFTGFPSWSLGTRGGWLGVLLIGVLLPGVLGCGGTELQDGYGQRNGPAVFASVNGTAVLAEMCEDRGHTVFSWPLLSPRLDQRADSIVWFPDDFSPPSRDACRWLERWLMARPNRSLVYVGRCFDAAPWYWEHVPLAGADATARQRIAVRGKAAQGELAARLAALPNSQDCQWFKLQGPYQRRRVRTLEGDAEWLRGVDPAKLQMQLYCRMTPTPSAATLLASQGDAIVFARPVRSSRLIVVANGSFLLNAPLANHEHRKLAGKLLDALGPQPRRIAFLESAAGGPNISDADPSFGPRLGLELMLIWPTNWILAHACLLGILFCFWRFPIFGRPIQPQSEAASDFGSHIGAVARLLERTGDEAYARQRLQHYRQMVRQEAAAKTANPPLRGAARPPDKPYAPTPRD